jgi:hypothetical protein
MISRVNICPGLYTDESPGLKVDPVVVLVLSLVFIFSVVALHSTSRIRSLTQESDKGANYLIVIAKITRKFSS